MNKLIAVVPVYLRRPEDLTMVAESIASFDESTNGHELIVVDDGSPERELVKQLAEVAKACDFQLVQKRENGGPAKACNVALRRARKEGKDVLVFDGDMEFSANGWLQALRKNPADIVGGQLLYPNGLVQHAGIFFSIINRRFDNIYRLSPRTSDLVQQPRTCPVSGSLMLIKHSTLEKIGLFDENYSLGFEDIDYCHEAFRSGLTCAYEPGAVVVHYENQFKGQDPDESLAKRYFAGWNYLQQKHAGFAFGDHVPTLIWDDEI